MATGHSTPHRLTYGRNTLKTHNKLVREWNKFIRPYNHVVRPRERGRPLAASAAQQEDVLKRRKRKESLQAIAAATGLGVRTVRTIIASKSRSKRTNEMRRKEFDKHRAAAYRVRKRQHEHLPGELAELQKSGEALVKAAKGMGRQDR
jgi:hypothetical protein